MKTYKDIDEFIVEAFPVEHQAIIKQRKSRIEEDTEEIDADFNKKLEKIINEEKKTQQEK